MKPVADRNAIIRAHEQAMQECIASPPQGDAMQYVIRSTSGTTQSGPLHVLYEFGPEATERFEDSKRTVLCMGMMGVRLTNVVTVRRCSEEQKMLCLDPRKIDDDLLPLLIDFAPDTVFGMNSFVLAVMQKNQAAFKLVLRKLMLTGEYLTALLIGVFRELAPKVTISQVYASSEVGMVSKTVCGFLPLNAYHPLDELEVEINEPDTGGVGAILVSKKLFKDVGIERYATGDTGKLVFESCPCGDSRILYLYGRSGYDYITLAGAILRKEEFDRVSLLCKDYVDEYRAEAFTVAEAGRLQGGILLKVYRKNGALTELEKSRLVEKFSSELFVTPTQTLQDLIDQKIFLPLTIENVIEPFERNTKEVTLRMRS